MSLACRYLSERARFPEVATDDGSYQARGVASTRSIEMSKSSAQQELERRAQKSFSKDERAKEREQRFIQEEERRTATNAAKTNRLRELRLARVATIEKEVAREKRLRGVTAGGGRSRKGPEN
jgi:hypothetical protein